MRKTRNRSGISLAEMLIVVLIIVVLMALAFLGVARYLRSMTKLEYDNYAKELFVAAQNHLTMARSQGYLGRTVFGVDDIATGTDKENGVTCFIVRSGQSQSANSGSVLELMLPPGSIDDTLRSAGCYIVRYHADSGTVLDVFYWETGGRYPYGGAAYGDMWVNRANKNEMMNFANTGKRKAVIGYFGGADAVSLPKAAEDLLAPGIEVINADTLYVRVTDPNAGKDINYTLTVTVTGCESGTVAVFTLSGGTDASFRVKGSGSTGADGSTLGSGCYEITIDDVTYSSDSDLRFANLIGLDNKRFTPGEDLTFRAEVSSSAVLANVASSGTVTDNSIYAKGSGGSTARIANIRHLENLDNRVSSVNTGRLTDAKQISDLDWKTFFDGSASILDGSTTGTGAGCYLPVDPATSDLKYDGQSHSVSNLSVSGLAANAGMFGTLSADSEVRDLKLVDIHITGATNAGALAGSAAGTVRNVVAVAEGSDCTISGSGSVGGLIGVTDGAAVTNSAAAMLVSGGTAGGFIGSASGGTITGCYAGGHTVNGSYDHEDCNVAGGTAGGFIGTVSGTTVSKSYATCSASGTTVGGFIGSGSGSFDTCYATGYVAGTTAGAFAGSLSGTVSGCRYYEIVNEYYDKVKKEHAYLTPLPDETNLDITPLDLNFPEDSGFLGANASPGASVYDAIVSSDWTPADPYDDALGLYYGGKYPLQSVARLGVTLGESDFVRTHYGDWPAPEVFVVNAGN